MTDYTQTPEWQAYADRVRKELIPMIEDNAVSLSIYSGGSDVKLAVELGFSLLLGKPLILVVTGGAEIPAGLRRAADHVIEAKDLNDPETQRQVGAVVSELLERMP